MIVDVLHQLILDIFLLDNGLFYEKSIRGVSYDSKQVQKQVQDVQVYVNGRYVSIIQSVSALSSTNHQLHVENQVHPEYYHAQERVNQLKLSVEESKEAENDH